MGSFFNTLGIGYKIMFNNFTRKFGGHVPSIFSGTGTGLMMIGSALIARDSCKSEVQEAINAANADLEKVKKSISENKTEKKSKRMLKLAKAHAVRGWKMVKIYKKGVIADALGVASSSVGIALAEKEHKKDLKAIAAVGSAFAGYRAAVVADLGKEADAKYMTGKKAINAGKVVTKDKNGKEIVVEEYEDENGLTIKKDPSVFKLLFSPATCPHLCPDNYDLRISNLKWVTAMLNRQYMMTWTTGGALTLNDMRREFGGLNPKSMDVDIGGIFGRLYDPDNPESKRPINLHYEDDVDFMEGRKDWCWIIFDCDPEPIIGRMKRKITAVED